MKYYAFISYSRKDEEWAKWIQHEFEHYKLPVTLNGKEGLPSEFRPIFRDVDELVGGTYQNKYMVLGVIPSTLLSYVHLVLLSLNGWVRKLWTLLK